jgi:hypothetical protein
MTELPQILVAHRDRGAQRRGARALLVVELDAAVERKRVLDVEVDVDRAGRNTGPQRRRDATVRPPVQRDDVLRDVLEIRQRSFLQRRRAPLDVVEIEIARALDPETADLVLGDLEHDEAALRILLRHCDADGLQALVVIGLLHRRARLLDVLRALTRAEERIDRGLDLDLRQIVRAFDTILVDVETRLRRRRLGGIRRTLLFGTLARLRACGRGSGRLCARLDAPGLGRRGGRCRTDRANDQTADDEARGAGSASPAAPQRAQQPRRTATRAVMIQTTRIHLCLDIILSLQPAHARRSILRTARTDRNVPVRGALSRRRCSRSRCENFSSRRAKCRASIHVMIPRNITRLTHHDRYWLTVRHITVVRHYYRPAVKWD